MVLGGTKSDRETSAEGPGYTKSARAREDEGGGSGTAEGAATGTSDPKVRMGVTRVEKLLVGQIEFASSVTSDSEGPSSRHAHAKRVATRLKGQKVAGRTVRTFVGEDGWRDVPAPS